LIPFSSIVRRKARLTELARIVLPPKREDTQRLHPAPESSPTVVPPAFPVAAMTARASQATGENPPPAKTAAGPASESPFLERTPAEESGPEVAPSSHAPQSAPLPVTEPPSVPVPLAEEKPSEPPSDFIYAPKVDPEAHKPEPSPEPPPRVDPEAHRPPPPPAPPVPSTELSAPSGSASPEKREFHLTNGERVAGIVLSETPEAVYIEHGTLGVLTIPRGQIAKRLVEIILINGDRIVGDIMAETADMLYVRHASLGMLSVPRAQRSTRVVEAILKDGDRILGDVLTETDAFTVIRSATLGTVTVPHGKVAMLNRKIEQIELKSLPPSAPELKDKPSG